MCLSTPELDWMSGKWGWDVLADDASPEAAKVLRIDSQNSRCRETSAHEKLEKFIFRANRVKEVIREGYVKREYSTDKMSEAYKFLDLLVEEQPSPCKDKRFCGSTYDPYVIRSHHKPDMGRSTI